MSITVKPIISLSVVREDKEFQYIVPNAVPYTMAYDALMEISNTIYAEIEKERAKHQESVKDINEQEKK